MTPICAMIERTSETQSKVVTKLLESVHATPGRLPTLDAVTRPFQNRTASAARESVYPMEDPSWPSYTASTVDLAS